MNYNFWTLNIFQNRQQQVQTSLKLILKQLCKNWKWTTPETEGITKFHLMGRNTIWIIFILFCLSCLSQILNFQVLFLKSLNTVYFQYFHQGIYCHPWHRSLSALSVCTLMISGNNSHLRIKDILAPEEKV